MVSGVECLLIANDPTVKGGASNPWSLRKTLRMHEIALHNRLPVIALVESGRRRPAHPEGGLHPGRRGLPQPHPAVGRRHPDDRAGLRQLDGRRRLPARHERPRGDDREAVEGVPGRPAAGQGGHRRGVRRRVAGRRRDARPGVRPGRLTTPSTSRTRSGSAGGSSPGSTGARPPARSTATPQPPRYAAEDLLSIVPPGLKAPFDPREVIARIVDDSDFDEVKPLYGSSLVTGWAQLHGFPVGILANAPRRAVQRRGAEGGPVHPARQPLAHAPAVPAQHDRLHGRRGVRAGRHHQARRHDDQRGVELDRPAHLAADRQLVRRRPLRHVRPGLRSPVRVRLAERPLRGDGRPAAGRRHLHGVPGVRAGPGQAVRRGRRAGGPAR